MTAASMSLQSTALASPERERASERRRGCNEGRLDGESEEQKMGSTGRVQGLAQGEIGVLSSPRR